MKESLDAFSIARAAALKMSNGRFLTLLYSLKAAFSKQKEKQFLLS